jgi:hypothetical protein
MATTRNAPSSSPPRYGSDTSEGWILFAGVMIVTVGALNVIWGIAALGTSSFFVNDASYIIEDLNTWGWVQLVIGVVQIGTAFLIWAGKGLGRWVGIAFASLNAIAALLSIPAYPFWSLAIFAVDVLVIYALAAHGGRVEPVF